MTENVGAQNAVVIERTFNAPAEVIWRMWTDQEDFKAWYGPAGAAIPVAEMDVRVGGSRLVCMEMHSGGPMQIWFAGEYRDVVENERLVYTEFISDENGNLFSPSDSGTPEGHPMKTEVSVELEAVDGRTKMVVTHRGISRRLGGCRRMDDGARQARRPARSTPRPIAPLTKKRRRCPKAWTRPQAFATHRAVHPSAPTGGTSVLPSTTTIRRHSKKNPASNRF